MIVMKYEKTPTKILFCELLSHEICLFSISYLYFHISSLNLQGGSVATKAAQSKNSSTTESKKKQPKEPGIKEGQSLPDNGSCKHYKKSHRWLRYVYLFYYNNISKSG